MGKRGAEGICGGSRVRPRGTSWDGRAPRLPAEKGPSGCPQVRVPDGKGTAEGGEGVREVRFVRGRGVRAEEREKWEKESGIRKENGWKGKRWGERKGQGKGESEGERGRGKGERRKGERGVPRRRKGRLAAGAGVLLASPRPGGAAGGARRGGRKRGRR